MISGIDLQPINKWEVYLMTPLVFNYELLFPGCRKNFKFEEYIQPIEVLAESLEDVFTIGNLIKEGVRWYSRSISCGDIVHDVYLNEWWICKPIGWLEISPPRGR